MAELYEQVWVMELDTAAEALFALVPDALHRVYRLQSTSHQNLFEMFGYRYEHLTWVHCQPTASSIKIVLLPRHHQAALPG